MAHGHTVGAFRLARRRTRPPGGNRMSGTFIPQACGETFARPSPPGALRARTPISARTVVTTPGYGARDHPGIREYRLREVPLPL